MKSFLKQILGIVLLTSFTMSSNFLSSIDVPQAIDLSNHFGHQSIGGPVGPQSSYAGMVEANKDLFFPQGYTKARELIKALEYKPVLGAENKLNPHFVKSGDFTNIAPSAEKIINPELTGPKVQVTTEINYPAQAKVPTFLGFRNEYQPVAAYDKLNGRIIQDKMLINKPIYGYQDKVMDITRTEHKTIDLNTGSEIKNNDKPILHGIEQAEAKK